MFNSSTSCMWAGSTVYLIALATISIQTDYTEADNTQLTKPTNQ